MSWKKYVLLFLFFIPVTFLSQRSLFATGDRIVNTPYSSVSKQAVKPSAPLTREELAIKARLDHYFMQRYRYEAFNGVVLIAHNGRTIYKQSFGYSDLATHVALSDTLPFELASVSKTFTSTAVLKLAEQGVINLDNPVTVYFPTFPYPDVTLRHLLAHRSGLPDYVYMDNRYITDRKHYMDNNDVVNIFCDKKPAQLYATDSHFEYSNTNYALLAAIVAKATGIKFQKYMKDSIFEPLGMHHSYVFDFEDSIQPEYARTHDAWGQKLRDVCFDGAVGDKGVYATAADMLLWDNALKTGKILTEEAIEEAYKPRSFESGSFANSNVKNYGYGWRMTKQTDGNSIIYHNGWWHGNNNVFARNLRDNTTIIILGNRLNQGNYYTEPIWNILKPLHEPDAVAEEK